MLALFALFPMMGAVSSVDLERNIFHFEMMALQLR